MATINVDFIGGKVNSERDGEGWSRVERCMRVSEVTGSGYRKHLNALRVSGMPRIGDPHPAIIDMEVRRYRFSTIDDLIVDVYPIYERVDAADDTDAIRVSGSAYTMDIETNRDRSGNLLTTTFAGIPQSGTVTIPVSGLRWTITKRSTVEPDNLATYYVGTYNSGPWSLQGEPVASPGPGKWKCVSWDYSSPDNGKSWDSVIVIERAPMRPNGTVSFDQDYYHIDPETGRIPAGVVSMNPAIPAELAVINAAVKTFTPYPLVDFQGMGL